MMIIPLASYLLIATQVPYQAPPMSQAHPRLKISGLGKLDGTLVRTATIHNNWPIYIVDYGTRNPIEATSGMRKRFGILVHEKNASEPWLLYLAPDDYPVTLGNLREVTGRSKYVAHGISPVRQGKPVYANTPFTVIWVVDDSASKDYFFPSQNKSISKTADERELMSMIEQAAPGKVGITPITTRIDLKAAQQDLSNKIDLFNMMLGAGGEAKYASAQAKAAEEQKRKDEERRAADAKRNEDARKAAELKELQRKLKEEEAKRAEAERKLREAQNQQSSGSSAADEKRERLTKIAPPAGMTWVTVTRANSSWDEAFTQAEKARKGTFMSYFRIETTPGDQRHPGMTSATDPIARGRIGNDWYVTTVSDLNYRHNVKPPFEEVQLLLGTDNPFGDPRQHRLRWVGFDSRVPSNALKIGIIGSEVTYAIRGTGGYVQGYTQGRGMFRFDGTALPPNIRQLEILVVAR